jgi:DNA-binding winged helix-turn-helix (wHTH) protein
MGASDKRSYEFGSFRLDAGEYVLLRDGQVIPMSPKVFETLLVLVENSGHVVGKEELYKQVWQEAFVEETNLTKNISILRKILSEGDAERSFIETVPKRGYRFVVPVRKSGSEYSEQGSKSFSAGGPPASTAETAAAPTASSAAHLISEIKRHQRRVTFVLAALVLIVIAVVAYYLYSTRTGKAIDSVAVLPFVNSSGDANTEYLSDGISETLINSLTQLQELRVVARHTAFTRAKRLTRKSWGKS